MANIHDTDRGRPVRALTTRRNRRPLDFPGWGQPGDTESLLPIPAGLAGTVTSVESHGAAPHTRYAVRFTDGSRAAGLVAGQDFEFTR
jgi:hypothetical protein